MKIAPDPYLLRNLPLPELPALVAPPALVAEIERYTRDWGPRP